MIDEPLISSMLDDDLYKITQGSLAFHLFPRAVVTYQFFNRGNTPFPPGFTNALQYQIEALAKLKLTDDEADWLSNISYIRPTYVEWLVGYRMNPNEVDISQSVDGQLQITIHGPWYRTIYWEVKLMAIISELYFRMTGQTPASDWVQRIQTKADALSNAGCHWIDFGTRRRFSSIVQDQVVWVMKKSKGFLGTSNPYYAFKHGITAHGTYAHESVMAMSALYGVRMANKMWMKHWAEHFEGNVGVALTDTFTTEVFDRDFGSYEARLFDGTRQDSGDEYEWGNARLAHYRKMNILTTNKRMVFSNALDTDKYIKIDQYFRQWAQPCGGIGTHFTNDVFSEEQKAKGCRPLNMVIKLVGADFGRGMIDVVKLSDDDGKHTGDPDAIMQAKRELNIV